MTIRSNANHSLKDLKMDHSFIPFASVSKLGLYLTSLFEGKYTCVCVCVRVTYVGTCAYSC